VVGNRFYHSILVICSTEVNNASYLHERNIDLWHEAINVSVLFWCYTGQ